MVQQEPASVTPDLLSKQGHRFVVFSEPRFTVEGEFKANGSMLFLHCPYVSEWNKGTYLSCLDAMNIIKSQALANDLEYLYVFLPLRRIKFASMMGFMFKEVYDTDAGPYAFCYQRTGYL